MWLALGVAGALLDRARRPRWQRATAVVGLLVSDLELDQVVDRAPAADDREPAAPDGDADRALVPVLALDVLVRGRARVRRAAADRAALLRGDGDGDLPPLPRGPLPVRRGRRGRAWARCWGASADDEGRASSGCRTPASPRSSTRSRTRARRPPTTRSRRSSRTSRSSGWRTSASTPSPRDRRASNIVPDTIEFHDIAGLVAGAHKRRGARQPVPGQHPRDRRAAARRARAPRPERDPPRRQGRPVRGHGHDRDRADLRRPRAGRAPARADRARRARRRPRRDRRGGVAARGDRGAAGRPARALGAAARRRRRTPRATSAR